MNLNLKKVGLIYSSGMFMYGFYREFNVQHEQPLLISSGFALCTLNGIFYAIPPITILHLSHFVDRLHIHFSNKNKLDYKNRYHELRGYNYNTF